MKLRYLGTIEQSAEDKQEWYEKEVARKDHIAKLKEELVQAWSCLRCWTNQSNWTNVNLGS